MVGDGVLMLEVVVVYTCVHVVVFIYACMYKSSLLISHSTFHIPHSPPKHTQPHLHPRIDQCSHGLAVPLYGAPHSSIARGGGMDESHCEWTGVG